MRQRRRISVSQTHFLPRTPSLVGNMGRFAEKKDDFYRRAKVCGYRARSAFKLLHLDAQYGLFAGVRNVVDLCAAPGSWSQALSYTLRSGSVPHSAGEDAGGRSPPPLSARAPIIVAVDLQEIAPIDGVVVLQGDITSAPTVAAICAQFPAGERADLVVCDGAPDVTGLHDLDCYLQSQLLYAALSTATLVLRPGGDFVAKVFKQRDASLLLTQMSAFFADVCVAKPPASRSSSAEAFVVCKGYMPRPSMLPPAVAPPSVHRALEGGVASGDGAGEKTDASAGVRAAAPLHITPAAVPTALAAYISCGDLSGFPLSTWRHVTVAASDSEKGAAAHTAAAVGTDSATDVCFDIDRLVCELDAAAACVTGALALVHD